MLLSPLNPPITDWRDRVVWLVGASSGIGRACAAKLHALGATVVVSARSADALQAFVAQHPGALALPFDVSEAGAAAVAAERIVQAHGRIDLVCYCAGTYDAMRATDFKLDIALQHQRVNVEGALRLIDAVLQQLLQQGGGHLSLVASVAGYRGLPQALAYGPTKAALINLAEILYLDLQPQGIGVSLVCPGFVETPLTAQNAFKMPALITPEQAAQAMQAGWARGDFDIHFPKRFTRWMKLLQLLPARAHFAAMRRFTGL